MQIENTIKLMFSKLSGRCQNVFRKFQDINTIGEMIYSGITFNPLSFKNCGRKTGEEFNSFLEEVKQVIETATLNSQQITSHVNVDAQSIGNQQKKIAYLAPQDKVRIEDTIRFMFTKLSTRCQHIFEQFQNIYTLEELISSGITFNPISFNGCGNKTADEFNSFLNEVKNVIDDATVGVNSNVPLPKYNKKAMLLAEVCKKFSFLLPDECEKVADFTQKHGSPVLYLAYKYITRNHDDKCVINKDYYGFNYKHRRYSLDEIARRQRLSRERVRQIVNAGIAIPNDINEKAIAKIYRTIGDVIAFDSLVWKEIREANMLQLERVNVPLLVCSISDQYVVIQIHENDKCYLVKRALIENVKVRSVCNALLKKIQARRSVIEQVDILSIIKADKRKYHRNVSGLCQIFARFISNFANVEINDNRYIVLMPNSIDISLAIENILSDKGRPMNAQELLDEFNSLHPSKSISSIEQLRPYIHKNPKIRPKGKRGIYILSHWQQEFTGSMVEYIEHILNTCGEPVHIDDILDFVQEEFPETTKNSVYSSMTGKYSNRFISYEGNLFWLADQHCNNSLLRKRRVAQRKSFDVRFAELQEFVTCHKRMPLISGETDDEHSLGRWLNAVKKGITVITLEQLNELESFLAVNSALPQNGHEHNFLIMCDQIKIILSQTFSLPNRADHWSGYNWFAKNKEIYLDYTDNRKMYFEDLLSYLKDFGFYLDK